MGHEKERIQPARERARYIMEKLLDIPGIEIKAYPEKIRLRTYILGFQLIFKNMKAVNMVRKELREGDLSI